ncbi:exodeoxyribonuclease VII large subunit [Calothrix sp. 336/3]|uniref:exodeoxyribonuclease VII large subunit n=1 Tax=Calothrix sp. 336/3 TaxID=1337936 RepID=UPI0004E3F533|nr:exodeoxyribonuclease VII large subunit [Calothrix sp. 336/3]AKG20113.1 exodeoxyribonuclease VII large subunit [Calothrix sp. 336/3]
MTINPPDFSSAHQALSVNGVTEYIQSLLEEDRHLRQVWVIGEVSSANPHRSGLFFTLQDPEGGAIIKCVAWAGTLPKLGQMPQVGEQIIILGSIRLYPQRGEYQLQVWQSIPVGVGLQALRFQQLRNRLALEGLFDTDRKRPIPNHPQTISVVTSPTAAAWGDIQKTLKQRYPGIQVLFSPATVQGEQAADSIVRAIARVERDGRAEVLILARGGGAVEELACFNDERVVRSVATCNIPVVTGIGHQRDESLTDLVADMCAHTPTAAAELVVPSLGELYNQHRQRVIDLSLAMDGQLARADGQLQGLRSRIQRLGLAKQLQQESRLLTWKRQQLLQVTQGRLQSASQYLQLLGEKISTLDPNNVLKRGYAVVRKEGVVVRSPQDISVGEELLVQLGEGEIQVEVKAVKGK